MTIGHWEGCDQPLPDMSEGKVLSYEIEVTPSPIHPFSPVRMKNYVATCTRIACVPVSRSAADEPAIVYQAAAFPR